MMNNDHSPTNTYWEDRAALATTYEAGENAILDDILAAGITTTDHSINIWDSVATITPRRNNPHNFRLHIDVDLDLNDEPRYEPHFASDTADPAFNNTEGYEITLDHETALDILHNLVTNSKPLIADYEYLMGELLTMCEKKAA